LAYNKVHPKTKYKVSLLVGVGLLVCAFIASLVWPGPKAIDAPWPVYWPMVGKVQLALVFLSATLLWLTGAVAHVYSDLLWQGKAKLQYYLAIFIGLPISLFIVFVFFVN
jgi:hypothetical protein